MSTTKLSDQQLADCREILYVMRACCRDEAVKATANSRKDDFLAYLHNQCKAGADLDGCSIRDWFNCFMAA